MPNPSTVAMSANSDEITGALEEAQLTESERDVVKLRLEELESKMGSSYLMVVDEYTAWSCEARALRKLLAVQMTREAK